MPSASLSTSDRRRRALRAAGGFLVLALIVAGVAYVRLGRDHGGAQASSAVAADSLQVAAADSAGADSTAAPRRGGILGFLRRAKSESHGHKKEDAVEAVPVETALASHQNVPSYFTGTASVEAEQSASVLAKIAGTVTEIHVEEGQTVEPGQLLLQIDDREERARLLELKVRAQSLQREYERTRTLFDSELASQRELDDKKLPADEAEAKLAVGEIQLGYTQVRAPFAGRITERQVHVGEYVQLNQQLFQMADFDPLLVRVFLPEREADRVQVGQVVRVIPNTADADADVSYAGRVRLVAPVVDTRSGTVKVTVELTEPSDLRIGAFVRVQITTDVHADAIVVPKVAVLEEGGETYVYRCEADSVVKVRVQTGYINGVNAEIVVGLQPGDRVVTVGHGGLKHGTRIRDLGKEPRAVASDSTRADTSQDASDVARR